MQKLEQTFNTYFNKYLKNVYHITGAYELKQTTTDSIPFSVLVEHQVKALLAVQEGTFVFKIPDCGFQNPFDTFCLSQQPAFVVIKYPKVFYIIPINNFLYERDKSKRKSLTSERAEAIAIKTIPLC